LNPRARSGEVSGARIFFSLPIRAFFPSWKNGLSSRVRLLTAFLDWFGSGFDGFSHWVGLADKWRLLPSRLPKQALTRKARVGRQSPTSRKA